MIEAPALPPRFSSGFTAIADSAAARDRPGGHLAAEIALLADCGALADALPGSWSDSPPAVAAVLHALGRASLPVGRLYEGHVNAVQLVTLYGSPSLRHRMAETVAGHGLLGVWGADSCPPVTVEKTDDGYRLSGAKSFCSGLGIVQLAVITATTDAGPRLFAVDVRDAARAAPDSWSMSGMRATVSGDFDFTGMVLPADAAVGGPGDYYLEPWFLGGMYRMCAVQAGGIEALLMALVAHVRQRRHDGDPIQQFRIGQIAVEVATARAVTENLAAAIAQGRDPAAIARQAVLARDAVETCAARALAMAERSGGTSAHREGSDLDRIRRDLGLYLRQAAVDARLVNAGAQLLAGAPL